MDDSNTSPDSVEEILTAIFLELQELNTTLKTALLRKDG